MQIRIKNVRTFCSGMPVPIRPLTLLVGENSSGKTTFLAAVASALSGEITKLRPEFNKDPFDLGSFDTLATFKGGRAGRADEFMIGFENKRVRRGVASAVATFRSAVGQPRLSHFEGAAENARVTLEVDGDDVTAYFVFDAKEAKPERHRQRYSLPEEGLAASHSLLDLALRPLWQGSQGRGSREQLMKLYRSQRALLLGITSSFEELRSLSPVRTKPRRTYDEIREEFRPEGDHVPVILSRIWRHESERNRNRVEAAIEKFGRSSGLFSHLRVKSLGQSPTDPFQIMVKGTRGQEANLIDVGYGVSQALPVILESTLSKSRLLLQQPEVHLHPRAQAALGSTFAHLVGKEKKRFIIETHSDYLIDRVRQEIAHGVLSPRSVIILFFDKPGLETEVHPLEVDNDGNVLEAPESYRAFFLEEELNLFNRTTG